MSAAFLACSLFFFTIQKSRAILPTAAIDVRTNDPKDGSFTLLASTAVFGTHPPMKAENNSPMYPVQPPVDDPLLCNEANGLANYTSNPQLINDPPMVMVVPRGSCTFQSKTASAQRLGYSGVIIYDNLASKYSMNVTSDFINNKIIYPAKYQEYDCNKSSALIPMSALSFDPPPYNHRTNDPILSGPASSGNLCAAGNSDFEKMCPSLKCLLTGRVVDEENKMEACCAWDFHIWLYNDPTQDKLQIQIPAFHITMSEADMLLDAISIDALTITMYERWAPKYNLSAILIWLLGVFVAALSSYMSASEYREARLKLTNLAADTSETEDDDATLESKPKSNIRNCSSSPPNRFENNTNGLTVAREENECESVQSTSPQDDIVELNGYHAIGFVAFSATGLLTLFYLKIYAFVKVMYAISCCNAMFQIIFYPMFRRIFRKLSIRERIALNTQICEIGRVTYAGLLAAMASYGLGIVWIVIGFTARHPSEITFFWIMQDIMGACVCITFMSVIKLNSIRVASLLLIAAFFYDIFFVFVTPYLTKGGRSIMVDVATSGGQPKADPTWCEKYPDDKDCQGGDPLPMLLTIPRLFDYAGSSSLLGLGDIVLPGLLISFAARFDEAKRFIGTRGGGSRNTSLHICSEKQSGYFIPLVFAYAVGLLMANAAVYMMEMGQPALLYLVPCCLGTMSYLAWRRAEFDDIWNTPKVLKTCDELLCIDNTNNDGEADSTVSEVEEGEAPLLPNIS